MAKQNSLSLTADEYEPVEIQVITGQGNKRVVDAAFALFSSRTLYLIAEEPVERGATVFVEHNDLTITGEVVRCEQSEDPDWMVGISLRYISTKMESLLRIKDVLNQYDTAFANREESTVASQEHAPAEPMCREQI